MVNKLILSLYIILYQRYNTYIVTESLYQEKIMKDYLQNL